MGNLGGYQLLTTLAKKVGGPKSLALLIAAGGYMILRPVEAASKKVLKIVKSNLNRSSKICEDAEIIFEVTSDGKDSSGLEFSIGDKYRVLESDGEAVLIEKLGDINNPYYVSGDFLRTISNFTDGKEI